MKKMFQGLLIAAMVMCLGATPALAGNTDYNTGKITNYNGTTTYRAIVMADNTKATTNADWFLRVKTISFTDDTSGTLGMAFTPMKLSNGKYATVGAGVTWAKTSFSTAKYNTWNGKGTANITYYLGIRLDSLLTSGSGTSTGYWNAN